MNLADSWCKSMNYSIPQVYLFWTMYLTSPTRISRMISFKKNLFSFMLDFFGGWDFVLKYYKISTKVNFWIKEYNHLCLSPSLGHQMIALRTFLNDITEHFSYFQKGRTERLKECSSLWNHFIYSPNWNH